MLTPVRQFDEMSEASLLSRICCAGWAIVFGCLVPPLGHAREVNFTVANFSSTDLQLYTTHSDAERLWGRVPAGHPRSHKAGAGTIWRIKRMPDGDDVCSFSLDHQMTVVSIDAPPSPAQWRAESLAGFQVMFSPLLLGEREAADKARIYMQDRLARIARLLPTSALSHLRNVRLWLDLDPSGKPGAFYSTWPSNRHNGRDRDYAGFHGAMYRGVVFRNIVQAIATSARWQPLLVLHELSHGYHHQILGTWNPDIKRAYEAAKAKGLYRDVRFANGTRASLGHALRDEWEYFAELTEAYFGDNDQTPLNADELRSYDPDGHRLVEQAWRGMLPAVTPIKMVNCRSAG